ncbi:hypothetical protein CHARACLAT_022310 [Characodon lateralis]|uniref:Uncharacterized protein n=1 Tax=Characodon lateralis TaxID=208331 RepID=A0ABU7CZU6_9TELE|nr:hypothetical protein [Characodon lateralis]
MVDSNHIMSHITPELRSRGSIKQAKESKILEYLKDFLHELEDTTITGIMSSGHVGRNFFIPSTQWGRNYTFFFQHSSQFTISGEQRHRLSLFQW